MFLTVIIWWLIIELIGLAALPLTLRIFRNLPDRGYAFARPLGWLLAGYSFWLLVTFRFLTNTRSAAAFALLLVAGLAWGLEWFRADESPLAWLGEHRRVVLTYELLFAVALLIGVIYRAYNPQIMGTEKPMEFAFLNGVLRSRYFPPQDPWLSGFAISYYYFGYILMGLLTRLTAISSAVTFNLGLALLFSLTVTGSFSLVFNLIRGREGSGPGGSYSPLATFLYSLLGPLFLVGIGNLEGVFELLHAKGWGSPAFWQWLDIKNLATAPLSSTWHPVDNWWWWRASRVIHDRVLGVDSEVIDEFPFFSFLLGDMHPHVLALPFVLLALALAFNLLYGAYGTEKKEGSPSFSLLPSPYFLVSALALGALGFLNSWDFPTYTLIFMAAYAVAQYLRGDQSVREWLSDVISSGVTLVALGLLLYVPFYVGFRSQAGGLKPVLLTKTKLHQYLIIFGIFDAAIIGLLATQLPGWWKSRRPGYAHRRGWLDLLAVAVAIGPLVFIGALFRWWTVAYAAALLGATLLALWQRVSSDDPAVRMPPSFSPSLVFVLTIAAVGLLLTLSTEFVYINDTFHSRMNTVFKFYFQAWTLLSVASAYAVYRLLGRPWKKRGVVHYAFGVGMTLLVLAGLVYSVMAGYSKAGGFRGPPTLDGWASQLGRVRPDDYAAYRWLQANVPNQPVLLEATGGSYSDADQISASTGLPTLLGWGGHELQWRGNYDEPGRREPDIATIYRSTDAQQVLELLDKYDVRYVYVGNVERQKYGLTAAQIGKFRRIMDVVYEQGSVTIFGR
jgi:YYY domain-containing protein